MLVIQIVYVAKVKSQAAVMWQYSVFMGFDDEGILWTLLALWSFVLKYIA